LVAHGHGVDLAGRHIDPTTFHLADCQQQARRKLCGLLECHRGDVAINTGRNSTSTRHLRLHDRSNRGHREQGTQ
jgi:hypothetical protein